MTTTHDAINASTAGQALPYGKTYFANGIQSVMDEAKKRRLEALGYRVGDYADFLGLTEAERQEVELRGALLHQVKRLRAAKGLTRRALGKLIGSTESSLTKLESGTTTGVSLDLMFRAFFAVVGTLEDLVSPKPTTQPEVPAVKPKPKARRLAKQGG